MRKVVFSLAVLLLAAGSWAQQSGSRETALAPQTARQALMEMFFSKTPGSFVKHLPSVTRAALDKTGGLKTLEQYSLLLSQLQAQGQNIQTFETGAVMLSAEDPKTGQKADITVENDALRGDQDDIELAFHLYKNGELQRSPFLPQITFSMKQEDKVWTLNEISVTLHLPLADPDLLKAVTEKMQASSTSSASFGPRGGTIVQPAGSDAAVMAAMRTILTAEVTYTTSYPTVGFTCTLSDLDGFGSGEPNEHQAMLISSGLASGKRYGFVFTLSGCRGTPAASFQLTAAPNGNTFGRKAFCADQSGVIRSSDDGNPATCLSSGTPIQ